MLPPRIPALGVYAVHAIHLNPAALQMLTQRPDHAPVLPLVELAERGGEDEHPRPGVAEDEEFHVALEGGAVPMVVFAMHSQ